MKRIVRMLALGLFLVPASLAHAQSGSITVEVAGINEAEGQVSIGLHNGEASFPGKGKVFMGAKVRVTGDTVSYTFKDVPFGTYAIGVYHDINSNGRLDRNFMGIPTEGYAFSNNLFGIFGRPPSFQKASFEVTGDQTVRIIVKY